MVAKTFYRSLFILCVRSSKLVGFSCKQISSHIEDNYNILYVLLYLSGLLSNPMDLVAEVYNPILSRYILCSHVLPHYNCESCGHVSTSSLVRDTLALSVAVQWLCSPHCCQFVVVLSPSIISKNFIHIYKCVMLSIIGLYMSLQPHSQARFHF